MDSDASENYEDLFDEKDAAKHDKLVENVLSLNKTQNLKKPSRTEPALQVSEFDLVKSITGDKGSVHVTELTKSLKNRKSHVKISENVSRVQKKASTLPKPLEQPQAKRIRRTVAYEKTRLELDRWEATVTANRVSTNLRFPLENDYKLEKKEQEDFTKMWRVKSDLAKELEKHEPRVEEYHISLETEKFPLTMKEMLAKRKEAAKLRAFQGYKEAKARRQNKIKSKKYHRIQRKERIKKALKEFEELQKTDPEEALKKLGEIEKTRVQERFSLRHKSTGKWAKNQQIRAKYDKESRQNLAQQLAISRELTQKSKVNDSESEEEAEIEKTAVKVDEENPWINGVKPGKEVADFVSGYRKFWLEQNKSEEKQKEETVGEQKEEATSLPQAKEKHKNEDKSESNNTQNKLEIRMLKNALKSMKNELSKNPKKKKKQKVKTSVDENEKVNTEDLFAEWDYKLQQKIKDTVKRLKKKLNTSPPRPKTKKSQSEKPKIDLSLPIQKKRPEIDDELITEENEKDEDKNLQNLKKILSSDTSKPQQNIDPDKYLQVKTTNLSTAIPDLLTTEDNEEVDQRAVISEAFEDDDILDEFNRNKKDEIDKANPKNIDLSLPGWGSWGGTNIKVNKRKKRRFTLKAPQLPRKDANRKMLIINEKAQSKIREHKVSEVPFPFKTVKDFEASMRAPISNTFVPETAYKKLIRPAVTTKMGAIIEPISKDILLNKSG